MGKLTESFKQAMQRIGETVKEKMIDTLFENQSYHTGNLARSIEVTADDDGFTITLNKYGQYVEDGTKRKPGRRPPVQAIMEWIKIKRISKPAKFKDNKSFAFAIAASIGKHGTRTNKPKPFIQPSIKWVMERELEKELTPELQAGITNYLKQQ